MLSARRAAQNQPEDSLRLNHVQVKGTHNSYHRRSSWSVVESWQYQHAPLDVQLDEQGVRAVELDTQLDEETRTIAVHHVPSLDDDTQCKAFTDCLEVLRRWSEAHPSHLPLFVQIEVKDDEFFPPSDWEQYADLMDDAILDVMPRERLITPDDVQGEASTLRGAVTTSGWPTLAETRGKVLFYLDDREEFYEAYTRGGTSCRGRILFPKSRPQEPLGALVIVNEPSASIRSMVARGFIVRTRADEFPATGDVARRREAALSSGAQILTTDYPTGSGGVEAFLPSGPGVSRCNPITAPGFCVSRDLETGDPVTFAR